MPITVPPKMLKRWLISVLHALLMLSFVFFWTDQDLSLELEGTFIKWQSLVKNSLTNESRQKHDATLQKALFVDVSNDKVEIWDKGTAAHVLITNRSKLNHFFRLIKGSGYQYVLNDLLFDLPAPQDDSLRQSIAALHNIAFCIDDSAKSVIPIPYGGITSYNYQQGFIFSDLLLKFRLVKEGGEKSLPLVVYEDLYKIHFKGYGNILATDKNTFYFNNLTLDACITPADLNRDNGMSTLYSLGDLLAYLEHSSEKEKSDMLQGKIIVVGDFKNDNCTTAFGELPGPIILYNLLLNIIQENNKLTLGWVLFLTLAFSLISYSIFFYQKRKEQIKSNLDKKKYKSVYLGWALRRLLKLGIELVFLFLVATLSYLWFGKNIEIIALILWISLLDAIIVFTRRYQKFKSTPAETRGCFIHFLFTNPET